MHELSIAQDLVDLAAEQLAAAGAARATAVYVRVGVLSGVVPAALRSAFVVAAAATPVRGARLVVEEVPALVRCTPCDADRQPAPPHSRRCPVCGAASEALIRGCELELHAIEIG